MNLLKKYNKIIKPNKSNHSIYTNNALKKEVFNPMMKFKMMSMMIMIKSKQAKVLD